MRRLLAENLSPGIQTLDTTQSHHARVVLRLNIGDQVELFDRQGRNAIGIITTLSPFLEVRIESVNHSAIVDKLVIASAVPKGDRADWLTEKLSEIGVSRWVPLRTERSVVHPEGKSKLDRWRRIAEESAKQSRRSGVMQIDDLTPLHAFLSQIDPATTIVPSTSPDAQPMLPWISNQAITTILIGPEGGWSDEEETQMAEGGLTCVALTRTILRIETAAMLAAGIVAVHDHHT